MVQLGSLHIKARIEQQWPGNVGTSNADVSSKSDPGYGDALNMHSQGCTCLMACHARSAGFLQVDSGVSTSSRWSSTSCTHQHMTCMQYLGRAEPADAPIRTAFKSKIPGSCHETAVCWLSCMQRRAL